MQLGEVFYFLDTRRHKFRSLTERFRKERNSLSKSEILTIHDNLKTVQATECKLVLFIKVAHRLLIGAEIGDHQ